MELLWRIYRESVLKQQAFKKKKSPILWTGATFKHFYPCLWGNRTTQNGLEKWGYELNAIFSYWTKLVAKDGRSILHGDLEIREDIFIKIHGLVQLLRNTVETVNTKSPNRQYLCSLLSSVTENSIIIHKWELCLKAIHLLCGVDGWNTNTTVQSNARLEQVLRHMNQIILSWCQNAN